MPGLLLELSDKVLLDGPGSLLSSPLGRLLLSPLLTYLRLRSEIILVGASRGTMLIVVV